MSKWLLSLAIYLRPGYTMCGLSRTSVFFNLLLFSNCNMKMMSLFMHMSSNLGVPLNERLPRCLSRQSSSSWGASDASLSIVISPGPLQAQGRETARQIPRSLLAPGSSDSNLALWANRRAPSMIVTMSPKEASKTSEGQQNIGHFD